MNLYSILEEMITWFDAQHYEPCYAVDDCPFRYDYDGAIEAGASKIVFVPNEGEYVYKVSSNYVKGDYCYREERNYRLYSNSSIRIYNCILNFGIICIIWKKSKFSNIKRTNYKFLDNRNCDFNTRIC